MIRYYAAFFQNRNKLNPFAWAIRLVEKRPSSHIEILEVVDNDLQNANCYGSVFPKSRSIKFHEMNKGYELMSMIPLDLKVPLDVAYTILQSNLGKPYSLGQILLIGLKIVFLAQSKWFSDIKLNLSKYQVCTEFAGIFMRDACNYELPCSPEMMSLDECEVLAYSNLKGLKDGSISYT